MRAIAKGAAVTSRWSGRLEPLVVVDANLALSRSGSFRLTGANFVTSFQHGYQTLKNARALSPFLSLLISRFPFDYPDEMVYRAFILVIRILPQSSFQEDLYWAFSGLVLSRFGGLSLPGSLPPLSAVARSGLNAPFKRALKTAVSSGWQTALNLPEPGYRLP